MAMADTIKHNRTLQHFYLDALKKQLDAGEECVAYTHERLRASCEVVTQRRRKIMLSSPWEVVKREMVWYVVQLTDGASKVELMIGGSSYQIDFASLTQTNVGTRRLRPIRRQLIMQDAENHCEIIKIEHLEVDLDRIREQLAAEHAKRKSAETVSSIIANELLTHTKG